MKSERGKKKKERECSKRKIEEGRRRKDERGKGKRRKERGRMKNGVYGGKE
jgi:hypothetical protein